MEEIILQNRDGEILASSREVAERFGKLNKNVNQSIKNLMVENSTVKNMFIETEYKSSRGRMEVEYLMNRDGFSLLVMGFTGKEALSWKLKYIAAFNKMEETIKHSLSEKDSAILKIVHANNEVECACAISNFEKVVTQPLLDTLEENQPLYDFANQVSNTDSLLDIGKVAKMLKEDGIDNIFKIYVHVNKINGKLYIGQTCQESKMRWMYGYGYKGCTYFENAIAKYGWNNFKHIILLENLSQDQANIIEEYLIKKYKTNCREYGYNIRLGGLNSKLPEETKQKIRKNASKFWLGKHRSSSFRKNMSLAQIGKRYSYEINKKKGKSGSENYFYGKTLGDSINAKPVVQMKDGEIIKYFTCAKEAYILTNIDSSCITKCCKHKRKSAGGFSWKYA